MATLRKPVVLPNLAAWLRSAVVLLGLFALTPPAYADTVSLEDLLKRDTIYIRDLKRLPYQLKSADGPVFLASVDKSTEIRFWFKPGVVAAVGLGRIVLIARGAPNDENHGTIIWPKAKVGHDYGDELHALYGR
jgi:hypothetical protein